MNNTEEKTIKEKIFSFLSRLEAIDYLAFGLIGVFLSIWLIIISSKYFNFGYIDWDLAYFSHSMWKIVHGQQFNTIFGINFLSNHANLIAYVIAPIYAIFQSALTLLILKILSYVLGSVVLYFIAKKELNWGFAILILFLYFLYPPAIWANLYEFHFETLAIFPLFLLFLFYIKNRFKPFLITAILILLIKENMPLIIGAFGIYSLFSKKEKRLLWSLVPIGLAILFLYFDLFILIPAFKREGFGINFAHFYGHLGETPTEALQTIFTDPAKIFGIIFSEEKRYLLLQYFLPVGFLSLLRPDILFFIAPIFLQHLLSKVAPEHTIYFHYGAILTPFIFLSMVYGLKLALEKIKYEKKQLYLYVTAYLLVCTVYSYMLWASSIDNVVGSWYNDRSIPLKRKALNMVPKDVPVCSSFCFLAPLANRKEIYALHKVWGRDIVSGFEQSKVGDDVEYAVIDFNDSFLEKSFNANPSKASANLYDFFTKDDWGLQYAGRDIAVFKKGLKSEDQLLSILDKKDFDGMDPFLVLDGSLELIKFDIVEYMDDVIHFAFYWHPVKRSESIYYLQFYVEDGYSDALQHIHTLGYKMYLPRDIGKDKVLREDYWFAAPKRLTPGQHKVSLGFINATEGRIADTESKIEGLLDRYKKLILGTYTN
ncbi:MAG: DUF2079 domain-containing protein [Candidatus Omnitrophica bacterium]|nr:DUF2079 domain-containing protein [Candidatus Omnitrophota bacterium]